MPGLFGLALISVLWAYDGFADLSFASGEVKDPQRNLPRAIIYRHARHHRHLRLGERRLPVPDAD